MVIAEFAILVALYNTRRYVLYNTDLDVLYNTNKRCICMHLLFELNLSLRGHSSLQLVKISIFIF